MTDIETKFNNLYCNNFSRIRNFANIYLKNEESSVSVTQEVFMRVLENREKLTLDQTLLPYIFVITKNRCLNILKKERAKQRYQKDTLHRFNIDISSEALNSLKFNNIDYNNLRLIYIKALNELPKNRRETFLLSRNNNLRYKQIADIQRISVKTVEYRIMMVLKHLRIKLKDYSPTLILLLWYITSLLH